MSCVPSSSVLRRCWRGADIKWTNILRPEDFLGYLEIIPIFRTTVLLKRTEPMPFFIDKHAVPLRQTFGGKPSVIVGKRPEAGVAVAAPLDLPVDGPLMMPPEQPHRPWLVPGRDTL
jgi:hypothetical protein